MDLRFSPEENRFREELRTFFREKVPGAVCLKMKPPSRSPRKTSCTTRW